MSKLLERAETAEMDGPSLKPQAADWPNALHQTISFGHCLLITSAGHSGLASVFSTWSGFPFLVPTRCALMADRILRQEDAEGKHSTLVSFTLLQLSLQKQL